MEWKVVTVEYFDGWFLGLDASEQQDVLAAMLVLEQFGPSLGRPYVDSLKGTGKVKNLKEVRVQHKGKPFRVFFAFDPLRPAVVEAARVQADQEIFELRLSQLRQTVEMSQHDLAVALGISQPSVANLEKRGHEVKVSSLKRYIEALGCKLSLDVELADGRHIGINV
jgi:hypothetical protein